MIFAIKKCIIIHQYIFSLNVTIVTDHKPLLRILLEEKGIPQFTAMRLQRWPIVSFRLQLYLKI